MKLLCVLAGSVVKARIFVAEGIHTDETFGGECEVTAWRSSCFNLIGWVAVIIIFGSSLCLTATWVRRAVVGVMISFIISLVVFVVVVTV